MMKCVKFVITAIIALFCFVISSELFQLHLQTFSNQYFFIDIENEDRNLVCSLTASAAEEYKEHVFAIERETIDAFHSRLSVYADEDMRDILSLTQNIAEGMAESVFSGSTEIVILPFADAVDNVNITRYYFTGSKDSVASIRQNIYSQIATSYIHREQTSIDNLLLYGIWIASLAFVLLLTWFDIQFGKKSDFLKISMGASVGKMIFGKIQTDVIFNIAIFGAPYIFLKGRIFLAYKLNFVCGALLCFFALNSLLYFTLMKADYKEVLYGANINGKLLANTYLLQAFVVILMILSLSSNLVAIRENRQALASSGTIEKLNGYFFLSVTPVEQVQQDENGMEELETDIYLEAYLQNKILLSTFCAAVHGEPIIILNEAALNTVVSDPELFHAESESDFIVYIPKEKSAEFDDYDIEFATATTAATFFGLENYSFDTETYSHAEVVYFDVRNVSELSFGSDLISDPVIVYCNLSKTRIRGLLGNNTKIDFGDRWANIMFDAKDTSFFPESVSARIDNAQFYNVTDLCNQYKENFIRSILLYSVFSIFLILLSVLLVSVIVKMEYSIHAKELAIKKILGYSVFARNRAILALSAFTVWIAFITGVFLSKMYSIFDIGTLCAVSLLVLSTDFIFLSANMISIEKHSTARILKGGSL